MSTGTRGGEVSIFVNAGSRGDVEDLNIRALEAVGSVDGLDSNDNDFTVGECSVLVDT